jgi:hypothetical protein
MSDRFSPIVLLLMVLCSSISVCLAQSTEPADARILHIDCDARLQKHGTATWRLLDPSRDVALSLIAGDQVKCLNEGSLEILIPEGKKQISKSQGPFTVVPVALPSQHIAGEDSVPPNLIAGELRKLVIAGATRGLAADSRILYPAEGSVVLPDDFVIRWVPVPQKIILSILSEAKDVTLWGPTETNGETGELRSAAVSSALADYKKKPAGQDLILTLTIGNAADWEEAHFSLLRGKQELDVSAQLDYWAKNSDGLALHLGRGYTFSRHKLFAEAAEEYEAALNSAPGSRYLLEDAIQANRLAGRATRVKELELRMASPRGPANP